MTKILGNEDIDRLYISILDRRKIGFSEKIKAIKEGIAKEKLVEMKELFDLDYETLGRILGVTSRTLHRYKSTSVFNRNVSNRMFALADLYSEGYYTFGDRRAFHEWLKTPSSGLDNNMPISLLDSILGFDGVKQEIYRLCREMHPS